MEIIYIKNKINNLFVKNDAIIVMIFKMSLDA